MYYYVLDGGSYEEYYKSVYASKTRYSQEEFMDLIKKAYKMCCEDALHEFDIKSKCDSFLRVEYILWDEKFHENLAKISNLIVIEGDEKIHVGTSITPNGNTREIHRVVNGLELPDCRDSCKTNAMLKEYFCLYEGC